MPQEIANSRVPCALQRYLYKAGDQISLAQLSPSECQLAFQHWVAYNSTTISKAISDKGDFVCPLLPCLKHFENLESCLAHLSGCSRLSDANYWCPFCSNKESFTAARPSRNVHSRKSSRFQRAIALLKHFGRHCPVAWMAFKPSSNVIVGFSGRHEGSPGVCELDARRDHPLLVELLDTEIPRAELSDKRHTLGRLSVQPSASNAAQDRFIEDFHRDNKIPDFGPPLSRIDRDSSEPAFTAFIALHELVDALNQEWIDKLTVHHGADVRFFLSSPFEKGIQSLQGFYCGTLPRTFEDIFALMHIVHACASIYHGKDEPHFWDAFFLDILQWHHAIAAEEEQLFFLKIAFQLWHVPGYSLTEATEYSNNLLPPLTWPEIHTKLRNTGSICFNHSQKPTPQAFDPSVEASILSAIDLNKLDLLRLRDAFSEGQVISLCTRYLDDFDYAKICARNTVETTQPTKKSGTRSEITQDMQTRIFDKLLQWNRIGSFYDPVIKAKSDLQRGLLLNAREVGVKLVVDGRSVNQSQSVYNDYRKLVCSLCDDAMFPFSYGRYYTASLDEVLCTFKKLQKRQPMGNALVGEENNPDGKIGLNERQCELPVSMKSDQSANYAESPASTVTCSTLIDYPDSDNYSTTLAPNSASSSSSVEFPSPTSNTSLPCPFCNKSYHGKKDQDQRSNLNRHIRSEHESHKVRCTERGCDKIFAGRRDNMDRHRRKHHQGVLDPCSPNLPKRRRFTG